jgi:hypothetical protein
MLRRVAVARTDVTDAASVASIVPSVTILVTLMMEAQFSSNTSVLKRASRRNIPEDGILHSHRRDNLKSFTILLCGEATHHSSVRRLLGTGEVPSSPFLVSLTLEVIRSSEMSVHTRATRCIIP